jgi:hypothetical protein
MGNIQTLNILRIHNIRRDIRVAGNIRPSIKARRNIRAA